MKKITAILVFALLSVLPEGVAHAQSCSNVPCLASSLKSNPVYVDPKAEVQLTEAQVSEIRLRVTNGSVTIFVALLPQAAADHNGGVSALPTKIGQAAGVPAVVAVIAGTSFRATSGGGAPFAKGQVGDLATNAFQTNNPGQRGGDVMPMLLNFVDQVRAAPRSQVTTPNGRTVVGASTPDKGTSPWLIFLFVILGLVVVGFAVWGVVHVRNRKKNEVRKESLKSKLGTLGNSLYTIENSGSFFNTEAKANLTKSWSYYRNAEGDLETDDLDGAQTNLQLAQRTLDVAERMAGEPEPPPPEPLAVPLVEGKRAKKGQEKITDAQVDPDGRVIINNNVQVPQQTQSASNPYYFGGGYYGGRMIPGGYYGMNFWDYMILDSILDSHRDYDRDDNRDSRDNGDGRSDEPASSDVGGGDWGGSSTPDYGGSDWGGSSGGGDWGGGGGDFGGGGGSDDSGGGGW